MTSVTNGPSADFATSEALWEKREELGESLIGLKSDDASANYTSKPNPTFVL